MGGFLGSMGSFYLFEQPMSVREVKAIYNCGHNFEPLQQKVGRGPSQFTVFPPNVFRKPVEVNSDKSKGYVRLRTCFSLDPRASSEQNCLPRGWGEIFSERIQGVNV